ncbi:hypothetical protein D6833_06630, partial [Candidatus Parcubacteria bacterium]
MAVTDFSSLANILLQQYGAVIRDALTQYGPGNQLLAARSIMGRLAAKGRTRVGSGNTSDRYAHEWAVHHATASAQSFGASDPYPAATQESYAVASLSWKRIGVSLEFDNLTRLAGRGAQRGGAHALSGELLAKLKALIHAIETQAASDGTGNSGKDLTGIKAFLSTSNTYAGIDQTTASYWRAKVVDAASASLAKSHLQSLVRQLFDAGAIGPNSEMWMSSTQWYKFSSLYTS